MVEQQQTAALDQAQLAHSNRRLRAVAGAKVAQDVGHAVLDDSLGQVVAQDMFRQNVLSPGGQLEIHNKSIPRWRVRGKRAR